MGGVCRFELDDKSAWQLRDELLNGELIYMLHEDQVLIERWRCQYNTQRPHWALVPEEGGDPWVPAEVYAVGRTIQIPRWQHWARAAQARLEELMSVA